MLLRRKNALTSSWHRYGTWNRPKNKSIRVSIADRHSFPALEAVRITPFGAWCVGFASKRPERPVKQTLVLADTELPILTIQGEALEKRLFLDQIGVRLGPERYRVTEASFIADCDSTEQIEKRIERFHLLVDDDPSKLWESLFETVRIKSTIFTRGEQAIVFDLPEDERIRSLFYSNPTFRSLAIKAEGGKVVCRAKDFRRLSKALMAEGFLCRPRSMIDSD